MEIVTDDVVDGHLALQEQIHIVELGDLLHAVVHHPDPRRQSGQGGFTSHSSAHRAGGLSQTHGVAAAAQCASGFQSGRAGTDHQDVSVGSLGADVFRVPAAPELLTHGGVLGASNGGLGEVT